jgi:hypothetical protein
MQSAKPNIERDSDEDEDESNTDFLKAATKALELEGSKEYLVTGATKSYLIEEKMRKKAAGKRVKVDQELPVSERYCVPQLKESDFLKMY